MKPRRVGIVLNSSAGTAAGRTQDELRAELKAAFDSHAIAASFEFAAGAQLPAAAARAVKSARAGEIDAIIAGGGDGTIRSVAGAVAGSNIALGVLPLGTLNHFAKDLKIPLRLDEAVAVIARGMYRSIDVGDVNGEVFINNSSIGIYPYLVLDRDRRRERHGMSKWTALALAAWRQLRNLPLRRLRVHTENWRAECRTPCVFIGNNAYELKGASFGSRGSLDRAELCLLVARRQGPFGLLWLGLRCLAGLVDQQDLRTFTVRSVDVSSRRKHLLVAFDGEVRSMRTPLHYRIRPGALRVLAVAASE